MMRRYRLALRSHAQHFAREVAGIAAAEFAMVAPVFALLLVAILDLGTGFYRKMQIQNAVQAGAQYAAVNGFDAASITQAVTSASPYQITAQPAPTTYCGCPSASGVASTDCGGTCASGTSPGTYVTISAQGPYSSLLAYPDPNGDWKMTSSFTVTAQAVVRIK